MRSADDTTRGKLLRGHLDGFILAALEHGPRHGYGIAESLASASDQLVRVPTGTLYPALHRLERGGLVESEWSQVDGRRRRTYSLTGAGRRSLAAERLSWTRFSRVVDGVLRT